MEEDIKLNKKEIFEALYILCTNNKKHTYGSISYEKIYEQLVDYIEQLEGQYDKLTKHFINNHIPKSKVQGKIECLKSFKGLTMYEKCRYDVVINHLQELMEDN